MRHIANIESPIHVGFESGLRVVEAHSQTAVIDLRTVNGLEWRTGRVRYSKLN